MRYGIVKRTALLATLIATGFSGLACKGPLDGLDPVGIETEFDGTDSEKTVYNPNFLWSVSYNNTIPACFVNGEAWQQTRVKNIVTQQFNQRTNVSFDFRSTCPASGFAVRVRFGSALSNQGCSSIGPANAWRTGVTYCGFYAAAGDENLVLGAQTLGSWFLAEQIAVHEFGHALGLEHEQKHPNAPTNIRENDPRVRTTGSYDVSSLMHSNGMGTPNPLVLSAMDIQTINTLYSKPDGCRATDGTQIQNCFYDPTSHLEWQKADLPKSAYFVSDFPNTYCNDLTLGGSTDWVAPTINQFRTLIRGCPASMPGGACPATDECLASSDSTSCINRNCRTCTVNAGPGPAGCYWDQSLGGDCEAPFQTRSGTVFSFRSGSILGMRAESTLYSVRCVRQR